ncbi:glycosyltransferase family 1 protein [Zopfia rhizophila CBS 207.26]|uniref:UDP-N-acetylglucosamine transferase subunit ALG14 n=1 Tax=Zopfia rhizophila CBS 207.26 TaxID=1314779 RepID=A0A6A6E2Q5_9PEZI|nr:glycosyltransferase family 1 protein [Zopfia rhizophila CBS 207.26]
MAPPSTSLLTVTFFLALLSTLLVAVSLRLIFILTNKRVPPPKWRKKGSPTRILIVLGSGGHTHEMFYLLRDLDTSKYTYRTYVVSLGDAFSAQRAIEFEKELEEREKQRARKESENGYPERKVELGGKGAEKRTPHVGPESYDIAIVPRARNIHQSLFTAPFTSLRCLLSCFPVLLSGTQQLLEPPKDGFEGVSCDLPDLIMTNGPATAVIVILASWILRFFDIKGANSRDKMRTIYVESFARVTTLSLSGALLLKVADRFLVQWEQLEGKGGRAEFHGILV